MGAEVLEAAGTTAWTPRDHVRAFYSGHSLSEGVPEIVEQIARPLGYRRDFEEQILGYSLLRQRTKGAGLNVAEELRQPRRLASGDKYDVLVVAERHDLPPSRARNVRHSISPIWLNISWPACRSLMQNDVSPAHVAFRQGTGILAALKRRFDTNSCRRDYADARDPDNPFASPKE
jgi:hypothetical protein